MESRRREWVSVKLCGFKSQLLDMSRCQSQQVVQQIYNKS